MRVRHVCSHELVLLLARGRRTTRAAPRRIAGNCSFSLRCVCINVVCAALLQQYLAESEHAMGDGTSQYIDGVALIGDGQKMELHTARTKLV